MTKQEILKQYYGYDSFREGQEFMIDSVLAGQDALGIMPTGAGKSLCYQVPALMMEGISLVISPLISLMKDQVGTLNQMGVHAAYLNSSLTYNQYLKALSLAKTGRYKIIYVAPERLLSEEFLEFALKAPIDMVSVDEAHCVSQWGQDFRPSYLKIADFIKLLNKRPVLSAFTATATKEVKEDIIFILGLHNAVQTTTGFNRPNLYFEVQKPTKKYQALTAYLSSNKDKSGIIYCSTRKTVDEVCLNLQKDGYHAVRYHAGLSDEDRKISQESFIYDEKQILVATNAFGMGIDKSNVRFVIHYNMPKNMESYYQEAGRAGRDGERAECILYYAGQDVITNQFFIEQNRENQELTGEELELVKERDRERLKRMTYYCHTTSCLRDYILRYFGEYGANYCGDCSNCLTEFEEEDISDCAYHIIGCTLEAGNRYGVNTILDVLRGSQSSKLERFGLTKNSYFNSQSQTSIIKLRQIVNHLTMEGFLKVTEDQYPILVSLKKGQAWMRVRNEEKNHLLMKFAKEQPHTASVKSKSGKGKHDTSQEGASDRDPILFEQLRALRTQTAREEHIPPYIVFSDKTLTDMCHVLPQTEAEMLMVHGVGQNKFNRYGKRFMEVIHSYCRQKGRV